MLSDERIRQIAEDIYCSEGTRAEIEHSIRAALAEQAEAYEQRIARVRCLEQKDYTCGDAELLRQRIRELEHELQNKQFEAQRVPDGETTKSYQDVAKRLYSLLDDIDSAGDIAKNDDALYRGIVERTQSKKGVFVISCDGYTVRLVDDSMLAAAPELLEALEEAVCALEVCGKDYRATEIARIAIAKAKGETK